jgi:hypothetical protein
VTIKEKRVVDQEPITLGGLAQRLASYHGGVIRFGLAESPRIDFLGLRQKANRKLP